MKRRIPEAHTETEILKLPRCGFCNETACYNGATILGPSAYMCEYHFKQYGIGLGSDKGQMLMLDLKNKANETDWNMFALAGQVTAVLQKCGQPDNARDFAARLFQCHSYNETLALIREYVEIYW